MRIDAAICFAMAAIIFRLILRIDGVQRLGGGSEQSLHAVAGAFIIFPFEDKLDLFLKN